MERLGVKDMTLAALRERTGVNLVVGVTDLERARVVRLSADSHPAMSVCTAVRASMALPPMFSPVLVDGTHFADGGLLDNFPLHAFAAERALALRLTSCAQAAVQPNSLAYLARISSMLSSPMEEISWCCLPPQLRKQTITILVNGLNAMDIALANDLSVRVGLVALGLEVGTEAVEAWKRGQAPRGSMLSSEWLEAVPPPLLNVVQSQN